MTMQATRTRVDIAALQTSWQAFEAVARLRPIRNEKDHERMLALMNTLLDTAGDDEDHPLSSLLELAGDLVSRYEQEHYPIEAADPKDTLRLLMESRGLKQGDLGELVRQGNLSAILSGKRKISAALAGKLGKFFGISPAVFIAA